MSLTRLLASDRTGLLGTTAGLLTQLPPAVIFGYLLVRIVIPVLLILHASRGATPAQRIALTTTYLTGRASRAGTTSHARQVSRRGAIDRSSG